MKDTDKRIPHPTTETQGQEKIDISKMSPLEIIRLGIKEQRIEMIDPSAIDFEEGIVDFDHAADLSKSIDDERGQLSPIVVRAREEADEVKYDVADGFHRSYGARQAGKNEIMANVMYGCDDEELQDLRILSVSSVRSVQFPRIARWMNQAFASTKWANKGLTVTQAFAVSMNDSSRARGIDMDAQDLDELKAWVKDRCRKWGNKPVSSAYGILRTVDMADPELVRQVRNVGGGKDRKGTITPDRLKFVVEAYPDAPNYEIQRIILDEVCDRRLSAAETQLFLIAVKKRHKPWMSITQLQNILQTLDISSLLSSSDNSEKTAPRPTIIDMDPQTHQGYSRVISRDRDSHNFYPESTTPIPDDGPLKVIAELSEDVELAEDLITNLKLQLSDTKRELDLTRIALGNLTWWRDQNLPLSPQERAIFEQLIFDRLPLQEIGTKNNLAPKEVGSAIARVIQKSRRGEKAS